MNHFARWKERESEIRLNEFLNKHETKEEKMIREILAESDRISQALNKRYSLKRNEAP